MSAVARRSLDSYQQAADLGEAGKLEQGWKMTAAKLMDDPMDFKALVTGAYLMRRMGGLPQAYHFALTATRIRPQEPAAWVNLGHVASEMWLIDEAEHAYQTGLKYATGGHRQSLLVNLSALYIDNGRFLEAQEIAEDLLAKNPTHKNALANLGFCQLAQRHWEGWKGYRHTIGCDWRPRVRYNHEPEWDGTPGKTVALYADQGLGDELSFASMIPDAIDICRRVIIDCDDRLLGLFKRSFPKAKIYGTKRSKEDAKWDKEDWNIDASLPLGQIGEYFRTTDASFPGTPYLVPCPDRVRLWKGFFTKPAIGIAWSGGVARTNARNRKLDLKDFRCLFELDAHFVSLQYKDASKDILGTPVVQYPWATLTQDYDDTAALIASLDYVICVQTAVAHAAGALGIPATVLVPQATQWRYGNAHESIPWYRSLKVIRQENTGDWSAEIERAIEQVGTYLGLLSPRAGEAARSGKLRDGLHSVCPAGKSNGRADAGIASA